MKAAIFEQIGRPLQIGQIATPTPKKGEILLKVHRCGICGSDLHMTEDPVFCIPTGAVLGHEFSGTIVETGPSVTRFKVGDRVTALPINSCGACASCLAGEPAWCHSMSLQGGGYAQYLTVHERQCVRLPAALSDEDGALVEPLAVGLHGVLLADMKPGAKVMIVGAGPIGLAVIYWAKAMGAGRIAVSANSRQREGLALEMGADIFVDPSNGVTSEAVTDALKGPPDIVFECVGKPGLIQQCVTLVRPRGTVVVLGLCTGMDTIDPFAAIQKEVRIQMAVFYGIADFEQAVRSLDTGMVEPRAMITDRISLDDLPTKFEMLKSRSSECKVMVAPNS